MQTVVFRTMSRKNNIFHTLFTTHQNSKHQHKHRKGNDNSRSEVGVSTVHGLAAPPVRSTAAQAANGKYIS